MSTEDDNKSNNKRKHLIIVVLACAGIAFALGAFFGLRTSQESPSKLSPPTTPKVPFVRSPTQSSPSAPPLATPTPLKSPPATNPELLRSPLTTPPPLAPPPTPQNNGNGQQNEDKD